MTPAPDKERLEALADRVDEIDHGDWVECWQCAGDGEIADCWEEYACVDPEGGCDACLKRCDICKGKGGWEPGQ